MAGRVRTPLLVAVAAAAVLALVWVLAYRVVPTRELDGSVYAAAEGWNWAAANQVGPVVALPVYGPIYVLLCGWALLRAWRRHGTAAAVAAGVVLAGSNVVTQLLKTATATDRPWSQTSRGNFVAVESWPSGHATASAALVVVLALGAASPAARARVLRWGGAWVLAIAAVLIWMGWHLPSDVVGGWCVVTAVSGVSLAGLRAWTASPVRRSRAVASAQSA